jgi:hypothetical protein
MLLHEQVHKYFDMNVIQQMKVKCTKYTNLLQNIHTTGIFFLMMISLFLVPLNLPMTALYSNLILILFKGWCTPDFMKTSSLKKMYYFGL